MKKIGKYKICGLLGKGGMGKVYKVEYPVTGKIGALKRLEPNPFLETIIGKEEAESMFQAEALTLANLRHPNIVEILDYDFYNGTPFYVMEFYCNNLGSVIGETYEAEKQSRKLSIDKALDYTRQVLAGLARLHFSSIIHRDIKPFNILITDYDTIKICDFGLSKLRNETFGVHQNLKIGTPYYAPPEQEADPESVDFSADLYAVGVMLFRMVTGRLPSETEKDPSRFNTDLEPVWHDFMKKALAPDPSMRFKTADEMRTAVDQLDRHWASKKEKICSGPDWLFEDEPDKTVETRRSEPLKVSKTNASEIFGTDPLMRPLKNIPNRFSGLGDASVLDEKTGLVWQKGGTRFPVNRLQADAYIAELNRTKWGGIESWRLPTIDELLSIVTSTPEGRAYCIESVFEQYQKWLWSSDRCTFITAWYVSLESGYVDWNDLSAYYHVKAVSVYRP